MAHPWHGPIRCLGDRFGQRDLPIPSSDSHRVPVSDWVPHPESGARGARFRSGWVQQGHVGVPGLVRVDGAGTTICRRKRPWTVNSPTTVRAFLTHVVNGTVLAEAHHACALYWSTPESEWGRSWRIFKVLSSRSRRRHSRPAAP